MASARPRPGPDSSFPAKKAWRTPALTKLAAGSAENRHGHGNDGHNGYGHTAS
jgi:hypothetical protein